MIPGVSHDSECSPAFDAKAKLALFFSKTRTNHGERSDGIPDSRSGLILGDFTQREQYSPSPRQLVFGAAGSYLLLPNMDRRYLPSYPRGKRRFAADEHNRSTYRSES